jgi:hypothetical protein
MKSHDIENDSNLKELDRNSNTFRVVGHNEIIGIGRWNM